MSGRRPLAYPTETEYLYDGGLKGFYCCVYESVYSREIPAAIWSEQEVQPGLLPRRWIETDEAKAAKVRAAVKAKISPRAQEMIETVFMSCLVHKELPMVKFLLMGFAEGSQIVNKMQDADVATLIKAERHMTGEAHLLKGFIRFADVQGRLIAAIRPKNFALPFIAEHFIERYPNEDFMIYDRVHKAALISEHGRAQIVPVEAMPEFELSDDEQLYQALWKQFYKTIGIKARENPRCRMTHMPKRYWSEMTEMVEFL